MKKGEGKKRKRKGGEGSEERRREGGQGEERGRREGERRAI